MVTISKRKFIVVSEHKHKAILEIWPKRIRNDVFLRCLKIVEDSADDGRNGVKKAVNWALRQIGKRDQALRTAAVETA